MEIYNALNYDLQDVVLQKMFKENVKKNKEALLEELKEQAWTIFEKAWCNFYVEHKKMVFCVDLNVFPNEVLISKPLNCKMMDLYIKINKADISNLFFYNQDDTEEQYFCNILYGSDRDFTYGDLVNLINQECIYYINYVKEEFNEDIQIGDHQFLEILSLKKVENIKNFDTYEVEFFMGS